MTLEAEDDLPAWLAQAYELLADRARPEDVLWICGAPQDDLFAPEPDARAARPGARRAATLPKEFLTIARRVICHADPARHAVLYRVAWRLQREPRLLAMASDADVRQLAAWEREVRRAAHKMKAFVRFRHREAEDVYVAWFDPGHPVLRTLAPFFVRRFASLRWLIVTPQASASWNGESVTFGPGAARDASQGADPMEVLWKTYYASIFNPARLMVKAMTREMPQRYWRDLPEAVLIPSLVRGAGARTLAMIDTEDGNATPAVPPS